MLESILQFLASDIRVATPILIAALGILVSEKAGIVNIGVEGLMLVGAFMGVYGSYISGNVYVGVLVAMISCGLLSLVFGYFTIIVGADQTVVGMAINIFAMGLTITLNRVVFALSTSLPVIDVFEPINIPLLSNIPLVGELLFSQTAPVYFGFLMVMALGFLFKRTSLGLSIKAVGENPKAATTMGINVYKVRFLTVLFSGLMAGIAGSYISMGQLSFFTENMVAGRGFIALAAVVFGNYRARGVLFAVLIFGAGDAISYRLQAVSEVVPYQLLISLPYIITIVSLCIIAKKSNQPAQSGVPYKKV